MSISLSASLSWTNISDYYTSDVGHKEVMTPTLKVISATTKVILTTEKVITGTSKVISATTKVLLAIEEVITATLNVISATTKVILATEKWSQSL